MDLLIGSIINHINSTPAAMRDAMIQKARAFIADAVQVVLVGASSLSER